MGLIAEDALERRAAAEAAAKRRSGDPSAWIALSQACQALADEEGMVAAARRAVDVNPQNLDALRQLASSLFQTGPGKVPARELFERLLALSPVDPVALHYLPVFALFDGDHGRAIELLERLDRVHPGGPDTAARIARAHRLMGDSTAAAEHFARAAARCESERHPFPYGPFAALKPIYTALAGDVAASERLSEQLCQESGFGLANLSHPRYPDDCTESILRLQDRVMGRDLFVFGFGPSLAEVIARKEHIAPLDFASMTLSAFPIAEDDLLRPIGKRVDLVCMTNPTKVRRQTPALREWLSAVPSSTLIVPLWLREYAALVGGPEFLNEPSDHVFWFDCFSELLPPSPADPLHFPAINTLICALPVGILARPRRVFLFGFDGQIQGHDSQRPGVLYYREQHQSHQAPHRVEPEKRDFTKAWLWWDSLRCNETMPVVLRHVALLFDLPLPPIYNVCIDSALDSFPRITFEQFRAIASSGGVMPSGARFSRTAS